MQMKTKGKIGPAKLGPPPDAKCGLIIGASSIGLASEDADHQQGDGADLEEARQVIARAEQQPDRQHRGDEAVSRQGEDRPLPRARRYGSSGEPGIRLPARSRQHRDAPRRARPRRPCPCGSGTCTSRRTERSGIVQAMVKVPQELPGTSRRAFSGRTSPCPRGWPGASHPGAPPGGTARGRPSTARRPRRTGRLVSGGTRRSAGRRPSCELSMVAVSG